MSSQANVGGTFRLPGTSLTINRMGYGAMQLPGPHVWGPPRDKQAALAVLREAVALGINHIDTADFYGPRVSNQLIREALQPYPNNLVIVTKIGYARGAEGSWIPAVSRSELEAAVKDNLRNLALESLDVVNLRFGGPRGRIEASVEEPLSHLLKLQSQGLVKHIGLSNVTHAQVTEGSKIASIVCVQNMYNLAHREDDALIDELASKGIAYTPFFPLGGFSPLQSSALSDVAIALKAKPMQVALAWLLQRSPNILLIPGTSSIEHLRENFEATTLHLPADELVKLNAIASHAKNTVP